ncbi:putative viral structural protein [Acidianus rod-shaped virus 3]|uniref:Putative viral structural protein n=1 Tax=Acidianus rod-shaped virus 3 TaxID=2730617 RepID=A0A6M3VZ34_9VIRU|nr:putative viral structural protein [Acidianus rod-shaped virus 3]QJF12335.1 putative viral structural protein [Acidianus rod-shaped virus 3]
MSNCDMFYYFSHGKMHDLYGLLLLIVLSIILIFSNVSTGEKIFAIIVLIVSTGVSVDLWAHCFHH